MQDRYVGDIGDFGKYALLNALASPGLRLGVVWYLSPDEEWNQDGRFIHYPELRGCDEGLYEKVQTILSRGDRQIADVEQAGILPAGSAFYSEPLSGRGRWPSSPEARRLGREQWFQKAAIATLGTDIVFLDPDNGFAPDAVTPEDQKARKHVLLQEILFFLSRDQSLVLYHHQSREGTLQSQIDQTAQKLRAAGVQHIWAMTFHRRSVRVYFVVAASRHKDELLDRSRRFAATLWGSAGHFKLAFPGVPTTTVISPLGRSLDQGAASHHLGALHREECEVWDGEKWNSVHIQTALEMRRQRGSWLGGRCPECHEQVRPHKLGTTGQRAHFEHLERNPNCSRSAKAGWD